MTPEEVKDKVSRDAEAAARAIKRLAKLAWKLQVKPKIQIAKDIFKAIIDED
jgi:hypothetical protein